MRLGGLVQREFGPFDGRVWLNTAHQGPLPRRAVSAAHDALEEKIAPARIRDDSFFELPQQLKRRLAELIEADPADIVLGNSTSYGLHVVAGGLQLGPGDEVLLVDGDFPATITPWLRLRDEGVTVRLLRPSAAVLDPDELAAAITPATRVFSTSSVFSLTGHAADIDALGEICRAAGVVFVVNASQALGARPLSVAQTPVDAVTACGFKWLCGPYATGFCWLGSALLERLRPTQAYWLTHLDETDLSQPSPYSLRSDLGASAFDVFCTANFLAFEPWLASVELLLELGIDRVAAYDQALVDQVVHGLDTGAWELVSPRDGPDRSTLIVLRGRSNQQTVRAFSALADAGIDVALRGDAVRASPHLHNDSSDVDRMLDVLDQVAQPIRSAS